MKFSFFYVPYKGPRGGGVRVKGPTKYQKCAATKFWGFYNSFYSYNIRVLTISSNLKFKFNHRLGSTPKNLNKKSLKWMKKKKVFNFLTDTLAKMSQNIVAYSFVSEHSQHLFFMKKTCILKRRGGDGSTPFSGYVH